MIKKVPLDRPRDMAKQRTIRNSPLRKDSDATETADTEWPIEPPMKL